MSSESSISGYGKFRRLFFGSVELVPVDNGAFPYSLYPDMWHVPGRKKWMSTQELLDLAAQRKVDVVLEQTTDRGRTKTLLN